MTQIGTIKNQEIKKNRDGSIAVRLLQVQISNESDMQTVQYVGPSGEDSAPINGDKVQIFQIGSAFKFAVSVEDQVNAASMPSGEKKLYSRDSAGAIAAFMNLLAGGNLELNGAADFAVAFTDLQTKLTALEGQLQAHVHPGVTVGAGSTGASVTVFDADISAAKVATVLLP